MSKLAHSHQPTMDLIEAQARADEDRPINDEPPPDAVEVLRSIMRRGERCILPRVGREFGGGKQDTREMFAFPWWMTRDIEALLVADAKDNPPLDCPGVEGAAFAHLFVPYPTDKVSRCARCGLPEADYKPAAAVAADPT